MADVYVDGAVLARVRANLRRVADSAVGPGRAMRHLDAGAAGSRALVDRLEDFGHEWAYGIAQIAKYADGAADALDTLDRVFTEADQKLGEALREAMR